MRRSFLAVLGTALLFGACDQSDPALLTTVSPEPTLGTVSSGPLIDIAPACGEVITQNSRLTADVTGCTGLGLQLGADGITLDCDGHVVSSPQGTGFGILLQNANNVTVRNCHVQGFYDGIFVNASGGETSDQNRILRNTLEGYSSRGLELNASNGNVVAENVIHTPLRQESPDHNIYGIRLNESGNNQIERNSIDNDMGDATYGISLWRSDSNKLLDNTAAGYVYSGIILESSDDARVEGNHVSGGLDGISLIASSDNHIIGNIASGHGHFGLSFWAEPSYDNRVENNDLSGNERASLLVSHGSQRNLILNNVMNDNGWAGFEMRDASHNVVWGNTIRGNPRGIMSWDADPTWDTHDNTFVENTIEGSRQPIDLWHCSSESVVGNEITTSECVSAAIRLYGCSDSRITDNVITKTGNHAHGIRLESQSNHNTVQRNTVNGSGRAGSYGIFVYGSDANLLSGNRLTETGVGGGCEDPSYFVVCSAYRADDSSGVFLVDADDNTVRDNTVDVRPREPGWPVNAVRLGSSANYCEGESNNEIVDNTLSGVIGLNLRGTPTNTRISGNFIEGPGTGTGVYFRPSSGNSVSENTVTGFDQAFLFETGSADNVVRHNNAYANHTAVENDQPGVVDVTENYWGTPCPPADLFVEQTGKIDWFPQLTGQYPPAVLAEDLNGDGYADTCGRCRESGVESVPAVGLLPQHLADVNADGRFEINLGSAALPRIAASDYSLVDTYGCTCSQILSWKPGAGADGETKFGCTLGTLTTWIRQIGWARPGG